MRAAIRGRWQGIPFDTQCKAVGLPVPVAELKFHPLRRWRFDWAFTEAKLAVEVEGGVWTGGRHTRGVGFLKDCEKYAEALIHGWRVLRVTPKHIQDGKALGWCYAILEGKPVLRLNGRGEVA